MAKTKKSKIRAVPSLIIERASRTFSLDDLFDRSKSESLTWPEELAKDCGLDLAKLLKSYGGSALYDEDGSNYLEGCLVIVELLKLGRVCTTPLEAQDSPISEKIAALYEIQTNSATQQQESLSLLQSSKERLEQQADALAGVRSEVASLQEQLEQIKQAPAAALQTEQIRQETKRAVLIAGLVAEGISEEETIKQATQFIKDRVRPVVVADIVAVSRMGRFSEQIQGDRRLKVEFATEAQAQAVLRAAYHLKAFNQSQIQQGKKPVGIDPFLTKEEVQQKLKLKGRFDQERAKGTPKVFWRGCRLFVNGQEVREL